MYFSKIPIVVFFTIGIFKRRDRGTLALCYEPAKRKMNH